MRGALAILAACLFWLSAPAGAIEAGDLLEPDRAFRFSARMLDSETIEISYRIAQGYYLYRDRFRFAIEPAQAKAGEPDFPPGIDHEDAFFGRQQIYRKELRFTLPVEGPGDRFKLMVTSQGCADVGVCYVPHTQTAQLSRAAAGSAPAGGLTLQQRLEEGGRSSFDPAVRAPRGLSASDIDIASLFESDSFWLVLASFLGFGLLLAFTPCMLPMIPILSGIIVGEGRELGKWRAFLLSSAYVLGMAMAYAAAGVGAAYTGSLLSAALQNPWVLTFFALVFVVLALAMFGLFHLQLPGFLHHRLHAVHHKLEGGRIASVALMGVLSAIIVSPCVAAPLAGALLYISQSRDVALGGAALFVMALGMGLPLIVVGVSEGALLPKAGPWMKAVKQFFGMLLLAVAVWIISPVVPIAAQMLAWAALLIAVAMLLRAIDPLPAHAGTGERLGKGLGLIALLAGASMVLGVMSGSRDPLRPLDRLLAGSAEALAPVRFERVKTLAELEQRLSTAGRPVMLDFYADWCVTCKEMERYTFSDAQVRDRLQKVLLLQVDVTANSEDDKALLKRFRLFGPPGIVFFDAGGTELKDVRVIGYQPSATFLRSLQRAGI